MKHLMAVEKRLHFFAAVVCHIILTGGHEGRDSFIRCLLKAISGGEIWTCFAPYLVCSCFLPAQMSKWSSCIHVLSVGNIKHQLHCSKLLFKSAKFKVICVHNGSSSLVILMLNVWWRFAIQNAGKLRKIALRFGLCFAFRHTMGLKTSFQIPLFGFNSLNLLKGVIILA